MDIEEKVHLHLDLILRVGSAAHPGETRICYLNLNFGRCEITEATGGAARRAGAACRFRHLKKDGHPCPMRDRKTGRKDGPQGPRASRSLRT